MACKFTLVARDRWNASYDSTKFPTISRRREETVENTWNQSLIERGKRSKSRYYIHIYIYTRSNRSTHLPLLWRNVLWTLAFAGPRKRRTRVPGIGTKWSRLTSAARGWWTIWPPSSSSTAPRWTRSWSRRGRRARAGAAGPPRSSRRKDPAPIAARISSSDRGAPPPFPFRATVDPGRSVRREAARRGRRATGRVRGRGAARVWRRRVARKGRGRFGGSQRWKDDRWRIERRSRDGRRSSCEVSRESRRSSAPRTSLRYRRACACTTLTTPCLPLPRSR